MKRTWNVLFLLILPFAMILLSTCRKEPQGAFDIRGIQSYREIPGISAEEIQAIEALGAAGRSFSYSGLVSTEFFPQGDGGQAGFTVLLCSLLSELFGMPFIPELNDWDQLKSRLDRGLIDFTGELTPTPERQEIYYMTLPIAERSLMIVSHADNTLIETEGDLQGLRMGTYEGTITVPSILALYPALDIEEVRVQNVHEAAQMLLEGTIDVFVADAVNEPEFLPYDFAKARVFFPLVYTPVSMSTINFELSPIITAFSKYIAAGGINHLHELYRQGSHEFARHMFNRSLSNQERAYLESIDYQVKIALEFDNYPASFYNDREGRFEGIAPDILKEISALSDIAFENISVSSTSWEAIVDMLNRGEISLVSEMIHTPGRREQFLWVGPYASSPYALISKIDYPALEIHQVRRALVGIGYGSAYQEIFHSWFPESTNHRYYHSQNQLFDALENGDVELIMASERVLSNLTKFRERPGYKVNIIFDTREESYFGLYKDEIHLASILQKALLYLDYNYIERNWNNRVFDFSRRMAQTLSMYSISAALVLFVLLVILFYLFFTNRRTGERYKNQMLTLSTMYNSLPDLVYSKNINGEYTSCNKNFEDFVGKPSSEIMGKTLEDVYYADEGAIENFAMNDRIVINHNRIVRTEDWLTYPDQTKRLFEIVKVPLSMEGRVTGLLGIGRDITQYRETERAAQEASLAKTSFLAKMSHEIRTPMNAIIGMAELALRETEFDAAQKHIFTVKQAGSHLLSIINDILDFSRIEMGRLDIVEEPYSFSSMINDVISLIRMRVIDSQLRFVVTIDSRIPAVLAGDETRIRQVLLNILSNAAKYTDRGFISFTVSGEFRDEQNILLKMEVMDSGRGIKDEDLEKLFTDYTQLDQESNRGIEGVGLGLAITWNIVNAMGGDINVQSEYGTGSTFTVTLPQKVRSQTTIAAVDDPETKKVLLYERRELYSKSIIATLDNLGVPSTLVTSDAGLREALEKEESPFIFISYTLLVRNRELISSHASNAKMIILAGFGETVPDKHYRTVAMPVYSISIANILNGIPDSFSYLENNSIFTRFIAPQVKVLVVDDINTNLKVAEGLLSPYQMQVDLCRGGREAVETVIFKKYDLIFMDHRMPDMDGVEATANIRSFGEKDPYYAQVPIIALTANAVTGTKEMFLSHGFNDFLSKPIDTVRLNAILEHWIPKEKRESPALSAEDPPEDQYPEEHGINIEGIDADRGISLSSGNTELYLETLQLFYRDGKNTIEELQKSLKEKDVPLYTIQVHGLKSSSANIGALMLSEAAKDLELAGTRNDLNYISMHHGDLQKTLEIILYRIEDFLAQQKTEPHNISRENPGSIDAHLEPLKKALLELDARTINQSIGVLEKMQTDAETKKTIQGISDHILQGEYDEAIELITILQGNTGTDRD